MLMAEAKLACSLPEITFLEAGEPPPICAPGAFTTTPWLELPMVPIAGALPLTSTPM